jgi:hypothetical protein
MKYSENAYLENDFFSGCDRDTEIKMHTRKIVTVRKDHYCMLSRLIGKEHKVKKGEKAIFDKAMVDGEFGSYYACLNCCDQLIDELCEKGKV